MQLNKFMQSIKEYYGDYNRITEVMLTDYIMDTFDEDELDLLFKIITDNFSNCYKTPPDKAKIKELIEVYNTPIVGVPSGKQNFIGIKKSEIELIEKRNQNQIENTNN